MEALDVLMAYITAVTDHFTSLKNRTHWLFLLSALVAAFISYRLYANKPFTLKNFFAYTLPLRTLTHPSARMDYFLFLLRPIWWAILLAPFIISIAAYADGTDSLLTQLFGEREAIQQGTFHLIIYTLAFVLALDFGQYYSHYLSHRYWVLWEFHKIHHSTEVLNPLSAMRFHPVDDLQGILIIGFFAGATQGIFQWLWGDAPVIWEVYGVDAGLFFFYFAAYNLRHSHVWLAYPRWLTHIIQSPCLHQIHHSTARKHWDKNIGFTFSFWDWMFGTLYIPEKKEDLEFGLGGGQDTPYQSPLLVYVQPFKVILHHLQSDDPLPMTALGKAAKEKREARRKARKARQLKGEET